MNLPTDYTKLSAKQKGIVRSQYITEQNDKCYFCKEDINLPPPKFVTIMSINWKLFPPNFLKHPIHLQHNHYTNMTEGAVHGYCNAVMWQYYGR